MGELVCVLYMTVACTQAVGDCGSLVGVEWSQLEICVVFIIVGSSSNSSEQQWYVIHERRN